MTDQTQIERVVARLLYDMDPEVVAREKASREAFAKRIGIPKRCKVGEVHPASGECLYCGAANGQSCQMGFGG